MPETIQDAFERLQKNLRAIKEEAQTIRIPKTKFTYMDWANAEVSARIIEKLIDDLIGDK